MGNTKLWWWPGGRPAMHTVDFGEVASDLQPTLAVVGASSETAMGDIRRVTYSGHLRLRLILSNFDSADLARQLRTLEQHLKAGYRICLALDDATAWAGFVTVATTGSTSVTTRSGNEFRVLTGSSAALTVGDEVVISAGPPECWREYTTVSSVGATTIGIDDAIRYELRRQPILLRHRNFFPALIYDGPLDRPILTDDHRRVHTLDLPLREDLGALMAMRRTPSNPLGLSGPGNRSGRSLDQLAVQASRAQVADPYS